MDHGPENPDKKPNKVRSYNGGPTTLRFKNESAKRKSFNFNEAVRSLDLALGRLKKTKFEGDENMTSSSPSSIRHGGTSADIFMDLSSPSANINPGIDNASLMSMNFSHYELMRNLSQSTSNSEGAYSGTTCNECATPADIMLKDEHLEKYFRSAEMWSRNTTNRRPNSVQLELSEK